VDSFICKVLSQAKKGLGFGRIIDILELYFSIGPVRMYSENCLQLNFLNVMKCYEI
jgi:hypothetical protein